MMDIEGLGVDVARGDRVVVSLSGQLTRIGATGLRRVLDKHLLDHGRVVVDLADVRLLWAPAVAVFPAALAAAGGWPSARMVLSGADPATAEALHATRVPLRVPITPDLAGATAALDARPPRIVRTVDLIPTDRIGQHVRSLLSAACADWEILHLRESAWAVATELATNAFRHATANFLLTITLDERGLTITVRDHGLLGMPTFGEHDLGLRVVDQISTAWGVHEHLDGKSVWALLGGTGPS